MTPDKLKGTGAGAGGQQLGGRLRKSRHGNQSFRKLVKKFNDVGLPFTDDQFRSADGSVFTTTAYKCRLDVGRIAWKRPRELFATGATSYHDKQPSEIEQQQANIPVSLFPGKWPSTSEELGATLLYSGPNQWFIGVCLALATHRTALLRPLLRPGDEEHLKRTGIVKATIWSFGTLQKVVVDDKLPVDSADGDVQALVFTKPWGPARQAILWAPLLEKAYAKLYGSFEAMAAHGNLATALVDLTAGGSVQVASPLAEVMTAAATTELIAKELSLKSLIFLQTKDLAKTGAFGLVANRLYLVVGLKKNSSSSSSGGTLSRLASKASLLGSSPSPNGEQKQKSSSSSTLPNQSHHQSSSTITLLNTIYEPGRGSTAGGGGGASSSFAFAGPKLQELTIPTSELSKHCSGLTICRPYRGNKDRLSRLIVPTAANLQLIFDVTTTNTTLLAEPSLSEGGSKNASSSSSTSSQEPSVDVVINLLQKSLTNAQAVGFRLHAVELNRRHRVHDFGSVPLAGSWDPVASRLVTVTTRLPVGRYLLTPISTTAEGLPLMVSVCAASLGGMATRLSRLTADMPRYQPIRFMAPKYPVAVSRLVVLGVEGLEKQDRFGSANPYVILRHGKTVIKSTVQSETLSPRWAHLSAVFYHKKLDIIGGSSSIQVEVWHRSLLMDYFIGQVKLMPLPTRRSGAGGESRDKENSEEEATLKVGLLDRKGVNSRPGTLLYQLTTWEDLKRF